MVSKLKLNSLPDIESLRKLSQSLAVLDAILSPDWEYRYYSFNAKWDAGEMMGSMRDGSGDEYFILFNAIGAIIKGFAHQSSMSPYNNNPQSLWPGVLDDIPAEFQSFLAEPAFSIQDTTFCVWRKHADSAWQTGHIAYPEEKDPDGSEELLAILDSNPFTYQAFAQYYYDQGVDLAIIEHIYSHKPLTDEMISQLNADLTMDDVEDDLEKIGYPGKTS